MKRSVILAAFACWALSGAITNAEYRIVLIEVKQGDDMQSKVSIRSEDMADRAEDISVLAAIKVIDKVRDWGSTVGVYVGAAETIPGPDRNQILSAILKNGVLDLRHFGTAIPPDIVSRLPAQRPARTPEAKAPVAKDAAKPDTTWDISKFPRLTGKVTHFIGHELGYVRPQVGEPFTLDFRNLAKLHRLEFDPDKMSYIPLSEGPLVLDSVNTYTTGGFASCRLRSKGAHHVVNIDIHPKPGRGDPNLVEVWISIEGYGLLSGVAVVDCLADGPFPGQGK